MQSQTIRVASLAALAACLCVETGFARTQYDHFDLQEAKEVAGKVFEARHNKKQEGRYRDSSSSDCPQTPSEHRIESLPYWAMDSNLPCMYSGLLSSSDTHKNYFFYWLAPRPADLAEDNSSEAPLIIYLNGGPGSSSMNALWTGNGPLRVTEKKDAKEGEDFEITYDTTISWQAVGDLLWIDQPAGTGWSTGEHYVTSLEEIAEEFLTFLLSFYEEFPKYKTRELVLTGESFGGKYLSYSSRAILDYNDKGEGSFKFNLKNLMLSNPLVDTPAERLEQPTVGWALGLYDDF